MQLNTKKYKMMLSYQNVLESFDGFFVIKG